MQGDLVTIEITALAAGGDSVGRTGAGYVVFVPDAVPGDRLEVRLVRVKRDHGFGQVVRVLENSPHRVRPHCIVADRCGSCQWQAVDYAYQLAAKRQQVIEALVRLGGFTNPPVEPTIAQPVPFGYRNKSTFPVGRNARGEVVVGYYRKDSHRIVNLNACPVQDSRLDPLLRAAKEAICDRNWSIYDEARHSGALRHLALRIGERTGEMLLTLVTHGVLPAVESAAAQLRDQFPDLVGVCVNENTERGNAIFGERTHCVAGRPYLEDILGGFRFRVEPTTFFQICTSHAESLARLVVEAAAAGPGDTVVDAYCGIGTLSLPLARGAGQVIGIESYLPSVEQARTNAQFNGVANCKFIAGTVEDQLPHLQADIVVLDPPRRGCERAVIAAISALEPRRIVYVSCNPATLARDLQLLAQDGYNLVSVQPVDLFAQTHHVESVALLVRG